MAGRAAARASAALALAAAVLMAGQAGLAPPAAGAPSVRHVDDDSGCGGLRPCYQRIQAAVDAAADGDEIRIAPGRYLEAVLVQDKVLTFAGPGSGDPLQPDNGAVHAVWAQPPAPAPAALTVDARSGDVTGTVVTGIRFVSLTTGVRLVGHRPGTGVGPPIDLATSAFTTTVTDARVTANVFRGATGTGQEATAVAAWWAGGTTIAHNYVTTAGIVLLGGSRHRVSANRVLGAPAAAVHVRAHGEDIAVTDNVLEAALGPGIRVTPLVGAGLFGQARSVRLEDNRVSGSAREGVLVSVSGGGRLTDVTVQGGQVIGAGRDDLSAVAGAVNVVGVADRLQNVRIEGLTVRGAAGAAPAAGAGIHVEGVGGGLVISGSVITDNAGPGVTLLDNQVARLWGSVVDRNAGGGVRVVERAGPATSVEIGGAWDRANRLGGNRGAALALVNETGSSASTSDVRATHNDWGTADRSRIEERVVHRPDDILLGVVTYLPAMAAVERVALAAQPPALVADGISEARLALLARDGGDGPVADDTLVILRTVGGTLDRPGRIVEAEAAEVDRAGEWGVFDSEQFGPFSGQGYLRSYRAGSKLTWQFDAPAVLVRYGQSVLNTGTLQVALDGEALAPIRTQGPQSAWVDRVLARGLGPGPHTLTLTVAEGEVNLDLLAAGMTTADGAAGAALRSGTSVGFGRVTARAFGAGGTRDVSLDVPFTAGRPADLALALGASEVTVGGLTTTVTVTATDASGRAVPDGAEVRFTSALGTVEPPVTVTRGGVARATYRSGTLVGPDTVRAESGAAYVEAQLTIVPGPPAQLVLSASRATLPANSTSTCDLSATVRDALGHAVRDGTTVTMGTSLGTLEVDAAPTSGGTARARLRAAGRTGQALVRAWSGAAMDAVTVTMVATDLTLDKSVEPPSAVVPGESVTFTLSYANVGPGPVYDVVLEDVVPSGLISPVVRTPPGQRIERLAGRPLAFRLERLGGGERGDIVVELRVDTSLLWGARTVIANRASIGSAGAAEGTPEDNTATAELLVLPGAVYTVTVSAPAALPVGGATGAVRAHLVDRYGNAARDGTVVAFSTDRGTVSPALATTRGGLAETVFASGSGAGQATVRGVTLEERGGSARVTLLPGPPSRLAVRSGSPWLVVGGASAVITASVSDQYGNGVPAPVHFQTDHGLLSRGAAAADATGHATTTLRSGVHARTARVAARSDGLWGQLEIEFRAGPPSGLELHLERWRLSLGDTTVATATAYDTFGNPAPGAVVSFRSTIATVQQPEVTTGAHGRAETLLTALRAGSGVVQASVGTTTAVRVLTVDVWRGYLPLATR